MTSEQKAKEVLKLQKEIEEIKEFNIMLECDAMYLEPGKHKMTAFIRKTTKVSFFGVFSKTRFSNVDIPDKMRFEILAKCKIWVEELERIIEELIPSTYPTPQAPTINVGAFLLSCTHENTYIHYPIIPIIRARFDTLPV